MKKRLVLIMLFAFSVSTSYAADKTGSCSASCPGGGKPRCEVKIVNDTFLCECSCE